MKRLTNKTLANCFETRSYVEGNVYDMSQPQPSFEEIYSKLSKHEDLEEELGTDLITLFKALKGKIYINVSNYIITSDEINFYPSIGYLDEYGVKEWELVFGSWGNFKLNDYGKTWSLNKEDLENE